MKALAKLRREVLTGLSKVGIKKATVYRENVKFTIPLVGGMGRFLFITHEPWRKKVLRVIAKMNPMTIFDVGVNVGQTMLDIKETMPSATYFGFEPNPACVFYTNELIKLNDFENTHILPFGLSNKSEMNQLNSTRWDDASSSILDREGPGYSTTIYTKNGDEFVQDENIQNVSFIKVDTEGYEYFVLQGLENTLRTHQPIVFCEIFSGSESNPELYQFLMDIDYHIYEQKEGLMIQRMDSDNLFNNTCHDYIFAPRNKSEEFEKHFQND